MGIKAKIVFELYRLVHNSIDAITENVGFRSDCQNIQNLQNLPVVHAPGMKNLKDLWAYAWR